jgi:hypothetical protein
MSSFSRWPYVFKLLPSFSLHWSFCSKVVTILLFTLVFLFSSYHHPPFHNGFHVLKLQSTSSFCWSLCFQIEPILLFTMVFMYSSCNLSLLGVGLCVLKSDHPPLHNGLHVLEVAICLFSVLVFVFSSWTHPPLHFIYSSCNLPLLCVGLHVLKLDPSSFSHWFYCFQIIVIFIFILVFLFSKYCPLPLPISICVFKLQPSFFSQLSSCWSCY